LSRFNHGEARARGHILEFVVDVRTQDGRFFRALMEEPVMWADFWSPTEGQIVGVEVEGDTQNVRFDKDDPRLSTREHERMQQSDVAALLAQPPGSGPGEAWPGEPTDQNAMAVEHPEWYHTRDMRWADRKPPNRHDIP
jgi:hypothetical protein